MIISLTILFTTILISIYIYPKSIDYTHGDLIVTNFDGRTNSTDVKIDYSV